MRNPQRIITRAPTPVAYTQLSLSWLFFVFVCVFLCVCVCVCVCPQIDWDYHMPLTQAGTPGQAPEQGSIIHYHHFRHWRLHGVAYELRDQRYNQPNRSMLSTAYGRTKEFKDR